MSNLLSILSTELSAFLSAKDRREYLIARTEKLFDDTVAQTDLPGPDEIIDPVLRAAIRPVVGWLYDEAVKTIAVAGRA
jgi:hypothetical protein